MGEPMTVEESLEKLHESVAGLGQALILGFMPAISSINAAAIQIAVAYEDALVAALNNFESKLINPIDFTNLVIEWTLENPERWAYESLVDWGKRLEDAGLFDNYETRLMYGAECWRAVLHSPIWYAGEVWYWLRYEAWEVARGLWTKN